MRFAVYVFFILTVHSTFSQQNPYPKGYFRYPLSVAPKLNANFGEMRPNHFHMGLDLSTERRENLPVYAAADGYVVRLKIEPGGFGRAIYLNHPNGYSTLYAHMNDFMPELEIYLKQKQYEAESWNTDLPIPENLFPVKKGQFIGFSGNTGGSQGPHVHFEIRETSTEKCVNPLLFGFDIPDNVPPDLKQMAVYDRNQSIYEQSPRVVSLIKKSEVYQTAGIVKVNTDKVSIAINATDRMSGAPNANGIYKVNVYDGNKRAGGFIIDKVGYDETRMLNAHIDYKTRTGGGPYLQQMFPLDGDQLQIYTPEIGQQCILLNDTSVHNIKIEVSDVYGNLSLCSFLLQRTGQYKINPAPQGLLMKANELNVFENDRMQLVIPENGLYDSIYFRENELPSLLPLSFSHIFQLHQAYVPIQGYFTIRIKADKPVPYHLRDKLVVLKNTRGEQTVAKAQWELGWYASKFRDFGYFQLVADDKPPLISTPGLTNDANMAKSSRLVVTVQDNYPTVKNFRAELDGNWIMFSQKGKTFTYRFDEYCSPGKHLLKIMVEDEAGNQAVKEIRFVR